MNKGFIFTMDAVLALIPIFIVLASVSALSSGTGLFLQSYVLGGERIAQDVLATMDYLNLIESTNATEVNGTLERLIPSYLNYSYNSTTFGGEVKFTLSRGDISQAENIMVVKRAGVVSSGYVAVVMPNIFAETVDPDNEDEAKVINSVLYSLLGIDEIDMEDPNYNSLHITRQEWGSIGRVTVTLGNLSSWSSSDNTIAYLVDRLLNEASAQGETRAVAGLTKFKSRLGEAVNGSITAGDLKYDIDEILDANLGDVEIAEMRASASDVLLAASQSANAARGTLNPQYSSTTTIKGREDRPCPPPGGQRCDYLMNLIIGVEIPTQISAVSVGKTFYSSKAAVNLAVYEIVRTTGNISKNANISYSVTSRPSFNITDIYEVGVLIRIDRFHSISFDVDGTGDINATAVYTTTTYAVFEQVDRNFDLMNFAGTPLQRDTIIFEEASGDLNKGNNYQNAREIADDGRMEDLFDLLLFDRRQGDRKRGYASVSDAKLVTTETLVILKIWGR